MNVPETLEALDRVIADHLSESVQIPLRKSGWIDDSDRARQKQHKIDAEILKKLRDTLPQLAAAEAALAAEKECQVQLAVRILGEERYGNSPCQAHPLQLVEQYVTEMAADAEAYRKMIAAGPAGYRVEDEGWNQCFTTLDQCRMYGVKIKPLYAMQDTTKESGS